MEISQKINEAFEYLRNDSSYVAMSGVINEADIDPNKFKKEKVEEMYFDHQYGWGEMISEDCGRGEILIPLYEGVYMIFEFNS